MHNKLANLVVAATNMLKPDLTPEEYDMLYTLYKRLRETEPDSSGCNHIHTCGFCAAREEMRKNA